MNDSLADGLARALADRCTPEAIRQLEGGGPPTLWHVVAPLGYADAFVAEEHGGIGLALDQAFELGFTLGRGAFPLPLLETAVARALLAAAGAPAPEGPIVLCDAQRAYEGRVALPQTPGLMHAEHALVRHAGQWHLLKLMADAGTTDRNQPVTASRPRHAPRAGEYRPAITAAVDAVALQGALARFAAPHSAAVLAAPLHAAEMAGSLTAVLDMTLAYANDRQQFGRAIGQFQALQGEISLLAELVAFATMAARMGCTGTVGAPDELRSLHAKLACSDAAERALAIAHAVHGAIGVTEEYPLGLHARRLHEWRSTGVTAGVAARTLGQALLRDGRDTLSFVREQLAIA